MWVGHRGWVGGLCAGRVPRRRQPLQSLDKRLSGFTRGHAGRLGSTVRQKEKLEGERGYLSVERLWEVFLL